MPAEINVHTRFHYRSLEELQADVQRLGLDLPVDADLSVLGQPVKIGGLTSPNRFAVLPMEGFDASPDGSPGELTLRRYRRYALGGAGLIWFEATSVLPEARSNPRQLYLHEGNVSVFARLVEQTRLAAREAWGREPVLVLQLTHSGRYSKPEGRPAPLIAAHNPLLDPPLGLTADYPMVGDDYLDRLQEVYVEAARLAAAAGFDGVDIKSCHRYLISELLSSYTRVGRYGGSFDNRVRLLEESMARASAEIPGAFLTTRLNVYDGLPRPYGWGVSADDPAVPDLAEPLELIGRLRQKGMPLLNLTIGNPYFIPYLNRPFDFPIHGASLPGEHPLAGVARFIGITRDVQAAFPDLPVIGAGYSWLRQYMPYVAAGVIKSGGAALIGQGRGSFAYPDSVRDILEKGRMEPAKCCVTCSACTQIMRDGGMTGCVVRDSAIYGPQYRSARRFAADHLREEAQRCRDCQEPTCVTGCPAGVDIPGFIKAFARGDIAASYAVLRRANALPEMCARICPSAAQCEGSCVEGIFYGRPIPISDLQLAVAREARVLGLAGLHLPPESACGSVAIVGGGPAGLACAIGLLEAGYTVTIYEKARQLGGVPDALIPEERFGSGRDEIKAVLAPAIASGRLAIACGRAVGRDVSLKSLRGKHDAVFLAAGLGKQSPRKLADGVMDAADFLAEVKGGHLRELNGRVAVLGGGDTAVDAAVTAAGLGAIDVYLVYRRSYLEMPAWEEDRRRLLAAGVQPLFLTQPQGYETEGDRLTGVRIARTRLGEPDGSGRRRPEIVPESESVLAVETAIEAMGRAIPAELLGELGELVKDGLVGTLPSSAATSLPGVFAGGDLVNGGSTAVQAVADGMRAAGEIDDYLQAKAKAKG